MAELLILWARVKAIVEGIIGLVKNLVGLFPDFLRVFKGLGLAVVGEVKLLWEKVKGVFV